ncbi:MAG TPA: sensor histidine kinase [Anaerolineaceae bacterium]|nr:sensor histidine kinase [Anaerolineaceae bacterium]
MRELALHILDLAENAIAAGAKTIQINVTEDLARDRLRIQVIDDGSGMDAETAARVIDPFYTSRTTRKVGLGIPLLEEAAEACNGELQIDSKPGKGTTVNVEFQRSHIDRMPLGDLPETITTLVISAPEIHWIFRYQVDGNEFVFDDEPIKNELGDIPLSEPGVLAYIRSVLKEGVAEIQPDPSENVLLKN